MLLRVHCYRRCLEARGDPGWVCWRIWGHGQWRCVMREIPCCFSLVPDSQGEASIDSELGGFFCCIVDGNLILDFSTLAAVPSCI
jgi:hypothetical protein